MNPIYNLDWYKFAIWNIAAVLQQNKLVVFVKALLQPVITLHDDFSAYQNQTRFVLHTTGQVCRLRGALNTVFDTTLRRITITDGLIGEVLYAYTVAENNPQYLPQFLHDTNGYQFIVNVPVSLIGNDADIRRFINTYKLPTTKYIINYV